MTAVFRNDRVGIINSLIDINAITPILITDSRITQKLLAEALFSLELPKDTTFSTMPNLVFDIRYVATESFQ